MPDVHAIAVTLPAPRLPGADWADSFEVLVTGRALTAIEAARLSLGRMPRWVRLLTRLRNALVWPIGLKPGAEDSVPMDARVGMFPVLSHDDRIAVLGLDDWHLDFRIVVEVRPESAGTWLRTTTLVRRKNLFGRFYIACVTPFHKIIVRLALKSAASAHLTAVTV